MTIKPRNQDAQTLKTDFSQRMALRNLANERL